MKVAKDDTRMKPKFEEIEFEKIEKVDPRSIWKNEAYDFTPWLAENLDRLGDAIGIELEFVKREADVGGFLLGSIGKGSWQKR